MACKTCKQKELIPENLKENLTTGAKIGLWVIGSIIFLAIYGLFSLISDIL
jgi:hypothetical protein